MAKLNQIVAVEKGTKTRSYADITEAHHALQKPAMLAGIARTYQPKDDEGEKLPGESTKIQASVGVMLSASAAIWGNLFDVTATKDWANCAARADVVVDGAVLAADVPVTYLLFLEKQLIDIHTFVKKLPVLDPSEDWTFDKTADAWATKPTQTVRTKKVPRTFVKAEATKEHPAQVEIFHEDVIVGYWNTIKFSGALPASKVREMLERVNKLILAVKYARESANSIEAPAIHIGDDLFKYLFDL